MSLTMRKLVVIGAVLGIVLLGNIILVANWLAEQGIVDVARYIRAEFLTGTAITITIILLVLLASPVKQAWTRHCPVCDHRLFGKGRYCSECGSKG